MASQSADRAAAGARTGRRNRRAAVVRSAFSYGLYDESNIRRRTDVEGGASYGRRLLQRLGVALRGRRRAGARLGRGVVRAVRRRLGVHRDAAGPGERDRELRLRHRALEPWTRPEAIGSEGGSSSTTRGIGTEPVIELRRDGTVDESPDRAPRTVPPGARERERRGPAARASCCWRARMRWARRACSRRCTPRPRRAPPSRRDRAGGATARRRCSPGPASSSPTRSVRGSRSPTSAPGGSRRPASSSSSTSTRSVSARRSRPLPRPGVPGAPAPTRRRRAGKEETFRRRAGERFLWVDRDGEVELRPGDQSTIAPDRHRFGAGIEGVIVSEFSTPVATRPTCRPTAIAR